MVYPKVVPTIPTVVYILTVVSSLSDNSPQHSLVPILLCVYNFMHVSSENKLTYYLLERKAVSKPANIDIITRREETNAGTKKNDSFGKGFDVLKDHVQNRLMTGRCPSKSLQLRPKFHSLFLQNSFDFQKSATNRHLECTDVSFNPENGAFSTIKKKTDRQTDRQTDKVTTVTLSRMRAEG